MASDYERVDAVALEIAERRDYWKAEAERLRALNLELLAGLKACRNSLESEVRLSGHQHRLSKERIDRHVAALMHDTDDLLARVEAK